MVRVGKIITYPWLELVAFGTSRIAFITILVCSIHFICYYPEEAHDRNIFKQYWTSPNGSYLLIELIKTLKRHPQLALFIGQATDLF